MPAKTTTLRGVQRRRSVSFPTPRSLLAPSQLRRKIFFPLFLLQMLAHFSRPQAKTCALTTIRLVVAWTVTLELGCFPPIISWTTTALPTPIQPLQFQVLPLAVKGERRL